MMGRRTRCRASNLLALLELDKLVPIKCERLRAAITVELDLELSQRKFVPVRILGIREAYSRCLTTRDDCHRKRRQ